VRVTSNIAEKKKKLRPNWTRGVWAPEQSTSKDMTTNKTTTQTHQTDKADAGGGGHKVEMEVQVQVETRWRSICRRSGAALAGGETKGNGARTRHPCPRHGGGSITLPINKQIYFDDLDFGC
jgi:hypothetical protein